MIDSVTRCIAALSSDRHAAQRRSRGAFTLIEAMIMIVILGIVGAGLGVGMQSALRVPGATERIVAISTELKGESENWRGQAFGASPWPSTLPYTLSDTVTLKIRGQNITYSRTTSIQNWDPNNIASNASPQVDFVQVQITINAMTYVTFLTNPN